MLHEDSHHPPTITAPTAPARRRRGRPLEMAPEEVLRRIAALGAEGALFRVHHQHPALYARARRLFGTWAKALARAGVDPARTLDDARRRSQASRRERVARATGT